MTEHSSSPIKDPSPSSDSNEPAASKLILHLSTAMVPKDADDSRPIAPSFSSDSSSRPISTSSTISTVSKTQSHTTILYTNHAYPASLSSTILPASPSISPASPAGLPQSGPWKDEFQSIDDETIFEEALIPPDNFNMVSNYVYRSSFPKKKNFAFLKKLGLRSML